MVSVGVSKLGCTELIFVDLGAKINGQCYRGVLLQKTSAGNTMCFWKHVHFPTRQRPSASCMGHDWVTARRSTPDFIAPDMWPPNSPHLNPVDYAIWSIMQQCVFQTRVHDIDELWQRLITVWSGLEQSAVDDAIDQWQRRLLACVDDCQYFNAVMQTFQCSCEKASFSDFAW